MIVSERYADYIDILTGFLPDELEQLYCSAVNEGIPVIRRQTQALLRFLLTQKAPENILEVGTAVGFSALFMSEIAPKASITTIEKYEKRIVAAKENFRRFEKEEQIRLLEGDAADILVQLPGERYDLIFMDAAKGQYLSFLPMVKRLLADGGLLVSDNVLQEGRIIESRYAVPRRQRTTHERMREYLFRLTHDEEFTTTILTVGDGVALSVINRNKENGEKGN